MAFENSQAFNIESKKMVNEGQFESVCRLEVSKEKPVKKVVSVHALPKIVSSEKIGDNLSFSGNTLYQVVYLTEEDKLTSQTVEANWQSSLTSLSEGAYFLNCKVAENTVTDFSSTEIIISTLISAELYVMISDSVNTVSGFSPEYVIKEKTFDYNKLVNTVKETFTEVGEQELTLKVDEILFNNAYIKVVNAVSGIDTISLEGTIYISSSVLIEEKVVTINKTIDFKQEFNSLSVVPENIIDENVYLGKVMVTASVSDIDNKTNLIYTVEVGVDAAIYSIENATVTEDAFSTKKITNVNSECLLKETYSGQSFEEQTVSSNFETDKNVSDILYLLDSSASITDVKQLEDDVAVSGVIDFSFICLDENKQQVLVKGYAPFVKDFAGLNKNDKFTVGAHVNSYRLRNDREIEVEVNLSFNAKLVSNEYITFINSVEEVEDKQVSEEAINVYVVKEGENLFDVAKNLSVKPEDIMVQNDLSQEELVAGTRLVVYLPLDINF